MNLSHSNHRRALRLTLAAVALTAMSAAPLATKAQDGTGGFLNAQDTMSCICWDDALVQTNADLNGPDITALRDEYNRVGDLLRTAHANLDTSDQAEVDSVARISERHTMLKQQLDQAEFPLLRRKAALATEYNRICASKKMLIMNVDAARANPQCPAMP
ncbi:MAG: hypothetical protein ACKVOI_20185 [Dongiaceae bacterium]